MSLPICRLCRLRLADKKNAHIVPKFLAKSILGSGEIKRAYLLDSRKADQQPQYDQDSPKMDHVVCSDCEKYFEIIETYISNHFYRRFRDVRREDEFILYHNGKGISWKEAIKVNTRIFYLFIYSIIWRCHHGNHVFQNFQLKEDEESILRDILLKFRSLHHKDLLQILLKDESELTKPKFLIITPEKVIDSTNHALAYLPGTDSARSIFLNEFYLIFSFQNETIIAEELTNSSSLNPIKILFAKPEFWSKIMEGLRTVVGSQALKTLLSEGKLPYIGEVR